MVKKTLAKTVWHHLYCDDCGKEMEFNKVVNVKYDTRFVYVCPECGKSVLHDKKYPFYEVVDTTIPIADKNQ